MDLGGQDRAPWLCIPGRAASVRHGEDLVARRAGAVGCEAGGKGTASAGAGASALTQLDHLILPAIPLVLVLFGYIARMARAGTIEALQSDYARTATLKGLKRSVVIRRHILRNSLLPTITVIATQTGYLIGGLVVVETLFNYQGIGKLIFQAAQAKDFPMLEAGVLTIGVVYMVATLIADLLYTRLNPRLRLGGAE